MTNIRISLLPEELKRQSAIVKRWTVVALVLSILAVLALFANFMFGIYLRGPVDELESLKDQNNFMTQKIGRLSYVETMFKEIESNKADIELLKGNDVDWGYVMNIASNDITLYSILVSKIRIDANIAEGTNCVINGNTKEPRNLTVWADELKNKEEIEYVNLDNFSNSVGATGKATFFFEANIKINKWNND